MKNNKEKLTLTIITLIVILNIISLAITIFANTPYQQSLRIVFGSIYVLFIPGFIISYIFFPKTKKFDEDNKKDEKNKEENKENENNKTDSIDIIERIALSFALSISIVPLTVFYLNLIGIRINLLNSFLTILGIIIISLFILYKRKKREINNKYQLAPRARC